MVIEQCCAHEAGHAFAAYLFDWELTLVGCVDGDWMCRAKPPEDEYELQRNPDLEYSKIKYKEALFQIVSGAAAEVIFFNSSHGEGGVDIDGSDVQKFYSLLEEWKGNGRDNLDTDKFYVFVDRVVKIFSSSEYNLALEKLFHALMDKKCLHNLEIRDILDEFNLKNTISGL